MTRHRWWDSGRGRWIYPDDVSPGAFASAGLDASLGVGHIWTAVSCPAYRTLDGADCTCNRLSGRGEADTPEG